MTNKKKKVEACVAKSREQIKIQNYNYVGINIFIHDKLA
jgi:hypothetical protein